MSAELPRFTIEEVSKHNKEDDMWIIINSKIYDVTKFLRLHPGGKTVLLKVAGQDCTKQFYALHEHAVLQKYEPKLLIGLVQDQTPIEIQTFGNSQIQNSCPRFLTRKTPPSKRVSNPLITTNRT